jgi:hypothetical protein
MIKLTLHFSSVAAARKALNELPEDLFAHVGEITPVPEKPAPKQKPAKPEPVVTPPTVEAPVVLEQKAESSAPAVDYPTLQKAVFALAGKSREAAAEVAKSFGVPTFKTLDESRWGEALTAVNAKIAELG